MKRTEGKETDKKEKIFGKIGIIAGLLFAFSIIAAALISSFELAMYSDFSVYEREYEKYNVLSELDMSMEDVMYVTGEMMSYLRGDREELSVITTVEGKEQDFFNEQDRFHMSEVRNLFLGGLNIRRAALVTAVLCLILMYLVRTDPKEIIPRMYGLALGVTAVAILMLALACAVDFNAVFVRFHHIFFDNNLWLFDPAKDYMIRMLPEGLFFDMVIRIGVFFAGILAVLYGLSLLPKTIIRKTYHKV